MVPFKINMTTPFFGDLDEESFADEDRCIPLQKQEAPESFRLGQACFTTFGGFAAVLRSRRRITLQESDPFPSPEGHKATTIEFQHDADWWVRYDPRVPKKVEPAPTSMNS